MFGAKADKCTFKLREDNLGDISVFAESLVKNKRLDEKTENETILIIEALAQRLVDWGLAEDADLVISGIDRLGEFRIKVAFEGEMFARPKGSIDSIEDHLLNAHDDKLEYSYHLGRNEITISVDRGHRSSLLACTVAALCAIAVYALLSLLIDEQQQQDLLANYVFPLETMYANAMLMIGAPMTFFGLLKNLTDTYIVSQRSSGIRELQTKMFITSAFAIVLAFVAFFVLSVPIAAVESSLYGDSVLVGTAVSRTFSDVVTSLITPSIFEPFAAVSPVPLMVVALLCTYALCSAGEYFATLHHAMLACYRLFSRMLHLVIALLPVFCFLALMDILLEMGFIALAETVALLVVISLGVMVLLATYAVRLRVRGIKVIPFVRKLAPLLRENLKIDSAINAAPYNTRFCTKVFKMDREMLEHYLPVLAEINLDGNCFLLAFLTLSFALVMDASLSWISMIGMAVLVLFLSLGAPNQPGGLLIGMLIIATYLGFSEELCIAIIAESFFGGLQNLVNVIGDIVMVAIEDSKQKALVKSE